MVSDPLISDPNFGLAVFIISTLALLFNGGYFIVGGYVMNCRVHKIVGFSSALISLVLLFILGLVHVL